MHIISKLYQFVSTIYHQFDYSKTRYEIQEVFEI